MDPGPGSPGVPAATRSDGEVPSTSAAQEPGSEEKNDPPFQLKPPPKAARPEKEIDPEYEEKMPMGPTAEQISMLQRGALWYRPIWRHS